jgi:hypothetical protein
MISKTIFTKYSKRELKRPEVCIICVHVFHSDSRSAVTLKLLFFRITLDSLSAPVLFDWNNLGDIKFQQNKQTFQIALKDKFLESLKLKPFCNNNHLHRTVLNNFKLDAFSLLI